MRVRNFLPLQDRARLAYSVGSIPVVWRRSETLGLYDEIGFAWRTHNRKSCTVGVSVNHETGLGRLILSATGFGWAGSGISSWHKLGTAFVQDSRLFSSEVHASTNLSTRSNLVCKVQYSETYPALLLSATFRSHCQPIPPFSLTQLPTQKRPNESAIPHHPATQYQCS